jgi:hypothetical protein
MIVVSMGVYRDFPNHSAADGLRIGGATRVAPASWAHPPCALVRKSRASLRPSAAILPEDGDDEITVEYIYSDKDETSMDTLVSLDIQSESCEPENLLRISPELHFPLNEVFEVPDEFNGHQRGTFYYRNARGTLRGPFMNTEEAGFDLCRHQYSKGIPCS